MLDQRQRWPRLVRPLIWTLVASLVVLGAAHSATPDAARRHYNRALGLFRQGQVDGDTDELTKSICACRQAIAVRPDLVDAH